MKHLNSVKRKPSIEGTTRALPANMYDAETIEAINVEQLVTATDRMLLRGRAARRRPSTPSPAAHGDLSPAVVSPAAPSSVPAPRRAAHTPAPAPRLAAQMSAVACRPTLQLAARTPAASPRLAARAPVPALTSPSPARDLYRQMMSDSSFARGSQPHLASLRGEPTLQIRAQPSSARTQVFAITVVIPTLVGIAVGLAALL